MGRAREVREWAEAVNCESRKPSPFLMGSSVGQREGPLKQLFPDLSGHQNPYWGWYKNIVSMAPAWRNVI